MRNFLIGSAVLGATLLAPLALHTPLAQEAAGPPAAQAASTAGARVIVKYRADSALMRRQALSADRARIERVQALGQRLGIAMTAGPAVSERAQVVVAAGMSSAQLAARLAAESDVEYAVADERKRKVAMPTDTFYASRPYNSASAPTSGGPLVGQWYLKPPGANDSVSSINAEQAWDLTTGRDTVVVAVLDTGLRFDHPDLQAGNVVAGYDMVSEDSAGVFTTANDGSGRDADASDPGDWITAAESNDPNGALYRCGTENSSWHGTQTLGLIGATTNNGAGVASVGRNVKVMPVRVLGRCGGFDSDIIAGMRWAAGLVVPGLPVNPNKARILNLSLGGGGACGSNYIDAINEVTAAGVVVVAAAGNSVGRAASSPANCPNVIAVGGLRHVGNKVGFSDLGSAVTLSAPGGNCINLTQGSPCLYAIASTTNSGLTAPLAGAAGASYTDSFNAAYGTSFSSPLVAGAAALMLSVQPELVPAEVRANLQASARPFPTTGGSAGTAVCTAPGNFDQSECYCTTSTCGAGMLDARAAVLAALAVQARIALATPAPTAGQPVSVTSSSILGADRTIAAYQWSVANAGTTGAAIVGSATGPTVTVTPTAAGSFTIRLAATDNNNVTSTASSTVSVAAAAVDPPPPANGNDDDDNNGGGGAIGAGWLLLLLGAVVALARSHRRAALYRD